MKRNLVIDANVPREMYYTAVTLADIYIDKIKDGRALNPEIIREYVLSYGDKNVYIKRLKNTK